MSTREREQLAHAVRLQAPGDQPPPVEGLRVLLGVTRGRHRRRLYLLGTHACARIAHRTAMKGEAANAGRDPARSHVVMCWTRSAQQTMPGVGLEPTCPFEPRILSPLRMPIPPPGPASASLRRRRLSQCARVRPRASETRRLLRCQGGYGSLTRIGRLVEASAFTHASALPGLRGPSALLRLQSDERLIALTRGGNHAAFEILCSRYHSRLLSFCRHMLASREDAEDVLQEVFAAAFNAVLADEREINVRPWLYRIARNRSLNHLRRATAVGVDSMDVHFADHGLSTSDRAIRRESFRELLSDVHKLPETQRTALLLREIDALSYEQIAQAMETTVPSVKSLLVRARISLAEAAEARRLSCEEVRHEMGEAAEGLIKLSAPARRHVRGCDRCRFFKKHLRQNNHALAAMLPIGPLVLAKKLIFAKLTASASSAHVAGGAGATVGAGAVAGAGVAGAGSTAGSIFTLGAGALTSKAVAGLAAAAIVSAGAVAADNVVV